MEELENEAYATSRSYKDGILSPNEFIENRPDMGVHTDTAIQSAIYTAAAMLNSHCGGMIKKVYDYTFGSNPDTSNELYRNIEELDYLKEAFITQTQFVLNNGNDFSQGSLSYSMGGVSMSSSRPLERDYIAPTVNQLLAQARVYTLFVMGGANSKSEGCDVKCPSETPLTAGMGDIRYVAKAQPNARAGQVATVDANHNVVFRDPSLSVDLSAYYTSSKVDSLLALKANVSTLQNYVSNETLRTTLTHFLTTNDAQNTYAPLTALTNYVTNSFLTSHYWDNSYIESHYVPNEALENFYTKEAADSRFAFKGEGGGGNVNLDNYYTKPETNALLDTKATEITNNINTNKVTTDTNQTITGNKEFQGELVQKITGNVGTIKIKNANDSVFVEIGKAISNSGGCFITTDTSEINLRSYNGGNVVIDRRNNIWLPKAPTDNNHGVNKGYVDNKVNPVITKSNQNETNITALTERVNNLSAPNLDNYYTKPETNALLNTKATEITNNINTTLTNVGKLNANNVYTGSNTFNNATKFGEHSQTVVIQGDAERAIVFTRNNGRTIGRLVKSKGSNSLTIDSFSLFNVKCGIDMFNHKISNLANPTNNNDAANKAYVDSKVTTPPKLYLLRTRTRNKVRISPQQSTQIIHSNVSSWPSNIDSNYHVISVMLQGTTQDSDLSLTAYLQASHSTKMVINNVYNPFGIGYLYVWAMNLDTVELNAYIWVNVVLVRRDGADLPDPARAIMEQQMKLADGEELEVLDIQEL